MTKDLEWLKKEAYEKYERMKNNYEITGNNTDNGMLLSAESFIYLIDQVEQAEITHEQALNKLAERYPFSSASIGAILEGHAKHGRYESELPELPVIPQFVANELEDKKAGGQKLYSFMSTVLNHTNHITDWKEWSEDNANWADIIARAWLDGYTVEEKKYRVILEEKNKNQPDFFDIYPEGKWYVYLGNGFEITGTGKRHDIDTFTEKEIKDFDERYWAFAEEVES